MKSKVRTVRQDSHPPRSSSDKKSAALSRRIEFLEQRLLALRQTQIPKWRPDLKGVSP
jgi:hypothetical protein